MPWRERQNWVYMIVVVVTYAAYVAVVLNRKGDAPLKDVAYVIPLLISVGVSVLATVVGTVLAVIANPEGGDRSDERDDSIDQRGELFGFRLLGVGILLPFGLAMADVDQFYIANAIYLINAVAAIAGSAAKLLAYRRGF